LVVVNIYTCFVPFVIGATDAVIRADKIFLLDIVNEELNVLK
jgi:hypothetical protein